MSGSSSSKTEKPTAKKLRDARKKGQVAKSKEVVSTLSLFITGIYFWLAWDSIMTTLKEIILLPALLSNIGFSQALGIMLDQIIVSSIYWIIIPFIAISLLSAVLGNISQFGFLLAIDPIIPKFSKINPTSGFKKIFSKKSVSDTGLALVKVLVIGLVVYFLIKSSLPELIHDISKCDVTCNQALLQELVWRLIAFLMPLLIAVTLIDVILQKAFFIKEQMMTKEEVKRELKDSEGDPLIKGKRKQEHTDLVMNSLQDKIKASKVLISDIDKAIAIRYERGETPLPVIMAMGSQGMARQMAKVAKLENVSIVENALAVQILSDDGKVDEYIPDSSIELVAQILRGV